MAVDKPQKISKTKGRPMLHWVGKKPIDVVQSYPAQLVETVNGAPATPQYESLSKNWQNLLFHGDNKEVLSTLIVNGFRGKIDLIYIDPPFDSGADYVRKVELRGSKNKIEGEEQSVFEQTQYTDIWANDNYLQFMYERLILLRELLSDKGSIYLHLDPHKSHQVKILMDEVFGDDNFLNEIIWCYGEREASTRYYNWKHDCILFYSKNSTNLDRAFNYGAISTNYSDGSIGKYTLDDGDGRKYQIRGRGGQFTGKQQLKIEDEKNFPELTYRDYLDEKPGVLPRDWFSDINFENRASNDRTSYPTQKPEKLLEKFIKASSSENSIVLDCFIGSGTTASVAQKLGRKWIGVDINKGAIQTTMKRMQKNKSKAPILHFRVNNYDFQKIHELKAIIIEKYDISPLKTENYFDGIVGERLVKIAELNQPVNKLTIQSVLNELKNRTDETRDILVVGSGVEIGVDEMIATHNKTHAVNKIEVRDVQADGLIVNDPAEADVTMIKKAGKVTIKINDYLSPTIIKRLDIDRSIFGEKISDFRSQIDVVVIDTNYDGKTFNIAFSDVPEKKQDLVLGEYELDLPKNSKKVAIKIIDMLGEETLIIE